MSAGEIALIWGLVSIAGFVVAGLGLIEGLYLGVGALIALGLVLVAPAWVSLAVFTLLLVIAIPMTRIMIRRTKYDGNAPATGVSRYIGAPATVTAPISDTASPGQVRVGGEYFQARVTFDHYAPVHLGTRVLVDGVDGSLLVVTPESALRERYARGEITYEQLEEMLEEDVG
ncbi:MAG: NfeD family protein [Thermoleophilia bacterium]|nr:NfeD family protein [Thermoleophilia bacterium]MDH3725641.1 NfeD family protein [Thermoleophilia bacterium]